MYHIRLLNCSCLQLGRKTTDRCDIGVKACQPHDSISPTWSRTTPPSESPSELVPRSLALSAQQSNTHTHNLEIYMGMGTAGIQRWWNILLCGSLGAQDGKKYHGTSIQKCEKSGGTPVGMYLYLTCAVLLQQQKVNPPSTSFKCKSPSAFYWYELQHCSKGVQPMPKAVYRSGCRDKHNCPCWDSNLGPLTPHMDCIM